MIVTDFLLHEPVLLVNVYAPTWDDVDFANILLASLPNLNTHQLILEGDLTCVTDPSLDHSSPKIISPSKMSECFFMFMKENECTDPWRLSNLHSQVFSFFLTCPPLLLLT